MIASRSDSTLCLVYISMRLTYISNLMISIHSTTSQGSGTRGIMWSCQALILLCGLFPNFIIAVRAAEATGGIKCFICDAAESPDQCTQLVYCGPDELCYLEHYVRRADVKKLYRGGCRSKSVCHLQTCLSNQAVGAPFGKRDESAGTICSECCNRQLCNLKLCHFDSSSEDDPNRALRCYKCNEVLRPEDCANAEFCAANEQCRIEVYFSNIHQAVRYRSDCFRRAECNATQTHKVSAPLTGRRETREQEHTNLQLLSECCDSTMCNNYDPFNKTAHDFTGKYVPIDTNCPTRPATTVIPTTITTTPTTATTTTPTTTTIPTTTTTTTPTTTTVLTTTATTTPTPTTIPTTPRPTTPSSCYVCNGPPFLCETRVKQQQCSTVDEQFCLNRFINNDDGTRSVFRSCGTEDECKVQWLAGTSDRHECTDYDTTQLHLYAFECTFCCTSANCNRNLIPAKADFYVGNKHG
ncbi:integumentary mucin C.1-like [Mizuhopecten yessoensis]|uniref:integumentary mucin C.1-like n=1 Tax=Mizuhopecten yessoensis TaxID=6573 RepID=UPI000B45E609|nr:integumentary mucin C.1-like [Mizuhopecten yessoensis]